MCGADLGRAGLLRRIDEKCLPHDRTVLGIECGDAAAEGAARIFRIDGSRFFPRGGGTGTTPFSTAGEAVSRRFVRLDALVQRCLPVLASGQTRRSHRRRRGVARAICGDERRARRPAWKANADIASVDGITPPPALPADRSLSRSAPRRRSRRREIKKPFQLQSAGIGRVEPAPAAQSHIGLAGTQPFQFACDTAGIIVRSALRYFASIGASSAAPPRISPRLALVAPYRIGVLIIRPKSGAENARRRHLLERGARRGMSVRGVMARGAIFP